MDIRELLLSHRANTGDSYSTIAHKTGLSKALIGRLMLPGYEHRVSQRTVAALSEGLGWPLPVVEAAALRTAGIQTPEAQAYEPGEAQLIAVYRRLPDQLKPVAIAQIEALRRGGAQDG